MATTPRLSSRDPKETDAIARLKTVNPDEQLVEAAKDEPKEPELVVEVEGEPTVQVETAEERKAPETHAEVPRIEPKVDVKTDEGVETLKKQIEELKAHRIAESQRVQEAVRRAQEAQRQAEQYKQVAYNSQYDSVVNTLSAAQQESETATQQLAIAAQAQDYTAVAEAQRRIAKAEAMIARLEDGKRAIEDERSRPQPQPQQNQGSEPLLPQEQAWLNMHPEVMRNQVLNDKLNAAYYQATNQGLQRGTQAYFDYIEQELGYRAPPVPRGGAGVTTRQESGAVDPSLVSAPVSRESQTMSGEPTKRTTFRLTKEQAEIAKISGLTPQEYAKQLIKLEEMKKSDPERYYGRS